jgi:DNA-binding NarL/FixJ family response regulator
MQFPKSDARHKLPQVATPIRVVLVEDQRRTREGLAKLIDGSPGFQVTGEYGCAEEMLPCLEADSPDVLLIDIGLPGMSGVDLVSRVREVRPDLPILVLTVHGDDEHVFNALCKGACGYLLKDVVPARLLEAIRELRAGGAPMSPEVARRVVLMFQKFAPPGKEESHLTQREMQVLRLLADGHSYKSCADRLFVSVDAVRFHVRQIYERLHVHSKSEAVIKALKSGWLK